MKKLLLSLFCSVLVLGACNTYGEKNYKKYRSVSYEQYEQQREREEQAQTGKIEQIVETPVTAPQARLPQTEGSMEDLIAEEPQDNEVIESTNSTYGEAVVVMASKKVSLGENASYSDMQNFQTALEAAYNTARRTYNAAGFTYAISPAGAVNPLSEMDVQCLLSETLSNTSKGKAVCDLFFKQISLEYNQGTDDTAL